MFNSLVSFAYDQARLDYEIELLQGEAFKPKSEKADLKNKPTQKQRVRVSNKSESKIVNLESMYFEDNKSKSKNKSSFDEVKMMNAAPLRSENTKKRSR